jgi:cytochrome P450
MFEAVLDELNTRMFQPWRAFLPVELVYRQHLGRLNALVQEVIETRRATWAKRVAAGEKGPAALVAAAAAETAAAAGGAAAPAPAPAPASAAAAADEVTDDTADGAPTSGSVVKAAALGGDMLDMMLGCGEEMSDAVLADELKTMLLAGHETSSMMLLWSCYLLCKHPDKMARAVAEVDAALGWPSRGYGSFEAYKGMAYLEQVMFEAMRLYSPVPVLTRETTAEVELCGQRLPPGTCIAMSVWALHRNPFAYMPFSLGPRNCIGRNLALIEAKVVLATVLQRFQLRVSAGQKDPMPTDCYVIPVRPEGGLYMDVAVRTA